jgi:hypothetical protein
MAKGAKGGMKAKLMEKHAAEQLKNARKPTGGKTWEMVCDCKKDDCAECAPRKKIDTFEPAHADRRSNAPARYKDEPSAPAKAAVPKAAAKKGTNPPVPRPVTAVSPVPKPVVLGERKRVRGH